MSTASAISALAWRDDPVLRIVVDVASRAGRGPVYLVGGYLRDRLLDRPLTGQIDLDLVSWTDPAPLVGALAEAFDGTVVPLDHETSRVLARRGGAALRIDVSRPKGTTIDADLAARDFTLNAMAVRLDTGPHDPAALLIDPLGGLSDLRRRRLRMVGRSALDADPVRLIRAVRLAVQLDLIIEPETREAIAERAPRLETAAGERVRDELFRMIDAAPAAAAVELLDALRLLAVLVPEATALKAIPATFPHRLPLWEHSIETLRSLELLVATVEQRFPDEAGWLPERLAREIEANVTEAGILKLAGLLHDIGKPETRSVQPDGRVRFFGHEEAAVPILTRLCERLRLSRQASVLLQQIARHHLRPLHLSREPVVTPRARYRLFREVGEAAPAVLLHSWADLRATIGEEDQEFARHEAFLRGLFEFRRAAFLPSQIAPLVRGGDLMETLGLEPGPFLGSVLDRVREAQAAGLIRSREEGLDFVRKHLLAWRKADRDA